MRKNGLKSLLAAGAVFAIAGTASAQTWQQFHGGADHAGAWEGYVDPDNVSQAWTFDPAEYSAKVPALLRDSQPAVAADEGLVFAYGDYTDFSDRGAIFAIDTVTGELAWTMTVAAAVSWDVVASPVYHGGYVYWSGSDGSGGFGPWTGYVYKINAMNGSTASEHGGWEATFPGEGFLNAPPVVADGRVFVTTYAWVNGTKHLALNDADGSALWTNATAGGMGGGAPAYDAARGLLYQTIAPDGNTRLGALAVANGTVAWASPFTLTNGDYQIGVAYANDRIYVQDFAFFGADGTLYVADAANLGALLWSAPARGSADTVPAVDPDGNVYAGGDIDSGWVEVEPGVWQLVLEAGRTRAFDADGNELWTVEDAGGVYGSPAWANGIVFAGVQNANELRLLDAADGSVLATLPGSGPVAFGIRHFYTIGTDGVLYAYHTGANYACTGMYVNSQADNNFQAKPDVFIQGLNQAGPRLRAKTEYFDADIIVAYFKKSTRRFESGWADLWADDLDLGRFRVPPPAISSVSTMTPAPGGVMFIAGTFWGAKPPKACLVETLANGRLRRHRCRVESAVMFPESGESRLRLTVPERLAPGTYELRLEFRHTRHSVSVPGIAVTN